MKPSRPFTPGVLTSIVVSTIVPLSLAWAANAAASSLPDVVNTAIRTHPVVSATAAEERAAREDLTAATAGYYPSLDVVGRIGREHSNIKALRQGGADSRDLTRREFAVTASQMLFDGFETRSEVERRAALLTASSARTTDVRESIALQATQAFLEVMNNRALVALARDNVRAHEETLVKVQRLSDSGRGLRADVEQGRSRLALAQSTLIAREGTLRESVANYMRIVGEAPLELRAPNHNDMGLGEAGAVDAGRLSEAVSQHTSEALITHPALKSAQAEVEAAAAAVQVTRASYWPRLDLEAGINRDDNIGGVEGVRNTNALMLVSRWNLFRGGGDQAREMASAERHVATKDNATDVRRAVEENVAVSVQAKATSEARLVYLRQYVAATSETLNSYQAQFEIGRRTLLDTLNARNELFNAQSSLSSTEYDDLLNYYLIAASKGSLIPALGLTVD